MREFALKKIEGRQWRRIWALGEIWQRYQTVLFKFEIERRFPTGLYELSILY